jgi:RNA polymerase sigma-70 factor (ECF subfamily)
MNPPLDNSAQAINSVVRENWGRLLAILIGTVRDFQLAEDSLQDAVESAIDHWRRSGLPRSPAGWLLQTARRKAIDRIRRDRNFERKALEYAALIEIEREEAEPPEGDAIPDERLRLIFTCCHPAIEEKTRIALTLRTLGGLTTREIARAFLDREEAMSQRLVRARQKIGDAGIPYEIPGHAELGERLATVLRVVYLIFNEGYAATAGDTQVRQSLCDEAIRLTRILCDLRPAEPEIIGLLALMLLHDSRRDARSDADGNLVSLDHQDRRLWRKDQINAGIALVERALALSAPGPFQIQAAISAVHAEAATVADTRWAEIVLLYELLLQMQPTAVVRLNHAVALSYAGRTEAALGELEALKGELARYQPFHVALADCQKRAGKTAAARASYDTAIALSTNSAERAFLRAQLKSLDS